MILYGHFLVDHLFVSIKIQHRIDTARSHLRRNAGNHIFQCQIGGRHFLMQQQFLGAGRSQRKCHIINDIGQQRNVAVRSTTFKIYYSFFFQNISTTTTYRQLTSIESSTRGNPIFSASVTAMKRSRMICCIFAAAAALTVEPILS